MNPFFQSWTKACQLYYFLHEGETNWVEGFLEIYRQNNRFFIMSEGGFDGIVQGSSHLTHVPAIDKPFLVKANNFWKYNSESICNYTWYYFV